MIKPMIKNKSVLKRKNIIIKYIFILLLISSGNNFYADTITVHNHVTPQEASDIMGVDADATLYARIYYYKSVNNSLTNKDQRGNQQEIYTIPSQQKVTISRPDRWRYQTFPYPKHYDRQLVFSLYKEDLPEILPVSAYRNLGVINIGTTRGMSFYIVERDMHLEGYNLAEWHIVKPLKDTAAKVDDIVRNLVKKTFVSAEDKQHNTETAYVRQDNQLNEQESAFVAKRKLVVKNNLEKVLHRSFGHTPTPVIAAVFSGGGYRAMLGTVGSLIAMEDTHLLDSVMYLVGLSGSTWTIGSFYSRDIQLAQFKDKLITLIKGGLLDLNPKELELIAHALLVKYAYSQELTLVDIFGALLATHLFGDFQGKRHKIYLSQQVDKISDGQMPFPLYSAVRRGIDESSTWWEFSPYEVGSAAFGMYIPSWAYGRKFSGGRSIDFAPEQNLGQELGTFGSAFAAEFRRIYQEIIDATEEPYKSIIKKIIVFIDEKIAKNAITQFGKKRIKYSWSSVNNFMAGMQNSPLKGEKELRLVDGGIDFNLPYPLVSGENGHRFADIMIFFDYSSNIMWFDKGALKESEMYARRNNLKFPIIDYGKLENSVTAVVFQDDEDSRVPVVIYMPLIKDEQLWKQYRENPLYAAFVPYLDDFDPLACEQKYFCKTPNFKYSVDQSLKIIYQTEFNFRVSFDIIKKAIDDWIDKRLISVPLKDIEKVEAPKPLGWVKKVSLEETAITPQGYGQDDVIAPETGTTQ